MKGTMLLPLNSTNLNDSTATSNSTPVLRCLPCPFEGCASCAMNTTTNKPVCLECERRFVLGNNTATGQPMCVRDPQIPCPEFCKCEDAKQPSLCTSCNSTDRIIRKEPGISNFTVCQIVNSTDGNRPCGPNCSMCNTLTGVCLRCQEGTTLAFNNLTQQFQCNSTCGLGCLQCNQTTTNCDECDSANFFAPFKGERGLQRCINTQEMCQPNCTACDTSGLQANPPVLRGVCSACSKGFYLNATSKMCQPCSPLCGICADTTGNCTECRDSTLVLFKNASNNLQFCTDRKCSTFCTNCDVAKGMASLGYPMCLGCANGFYLNSSSDCQSCPTNCALCDNKGTCTQCKSGFTLLTSSNQCVTGASTASCNIPYCGTCDSTNTSQCLACTSGYLLNSTGGCSCGNTLTFKGQYYSQDFGQIVLQWNGQLMPLSTINTTNAQLFCTQILETSTLTDFKNTETPHQCYFKYNDVTKISTFIMVLNQTYSPATLIKAISIKFSLLTSTCPTALSSSAFTAVQIAVPEAQSPQVVLDVIPSPQVPLGAQNFQITTVRTQGLYGKRATFTWNVNSVTPSDPSTLSNWKTLVAFSEPQIQLNSTQIAAFQGKSVSLSINIVNFLGSQNQSTISITFLSYEGLIWRNVPDNIVVNPNQDFSIQPQIGISATNLTSEIVAKFPRLQVNCSLFVRNVSTMRFQFASGLKQCSIAAGMMQYNFEYLVVLIGFDPLEEYKVNIFKNITVQLVKPPLTASIDGGDQTVDPSKDLTISVTGNSLTKDLVYAWSCIDPSQGVTCTSRNNTKIYLQGSQSVLIRANSFNNSKSFKIVFQVSDPNDPTRTATASILLTTLGISVYPLGVKILSPANDQNGYFSIFERQVFTVLLFDSNATRIVDTGYYVKYWTILDSNQVNFTNYVIVGDSLVIAPNSFSQNNLYTVCAMVQNNQTIIVDGKVATNSTKEYGRTCQQYSALGTTSNFRFTISPSSGIAFSTAFTFSCQAGSSVSTQYSFEFGIAQQALAADNKTTIQVFVPFELASTTASKQFKLKPTPLGQTIQKAYTKITNQKGEIYYLFGEVTVTNQTLSTKDVATTVQTTSYDNLNDLYTSAQMVSQVASSLDKSTSKAVVSTLLTGIATLTTSTQNQSSSSSNSASTTSNTLTIAQSLSTVTTLFKQDPTILSSSDKDKLKNVITTLVGIDSKDTTLYASTGASQSSGNSGQSQSGGGLSTSVGGSTTSSEQTTTVKKYDSTTATAIIKFCDDLLTGSASAGNQSDSSLQQQAITGIKKVLSGTLADSDSTFTYSSTFMNAQAVKFTSISSAAGRMLATSSSTKGQTISITDPRDTSVAAKVQVKMPTNTDVCGGSTCQMSVITLKAPAIQATSEKGGEVVASTISVSFEKSSSTSSSQLTVQKVRVNNLQEPIVIKIKPDATKIKEGEKQRCVYFDDLTNKMSDSGVITQIDAVTGEITCKVYHLTDFSIESFDPSFSLIPNMDPNLRKVESFKAIPIEQTFPVPGMLLISLLTIAFIVFGILLDKRDFKRQENQDKAPTRLRDVLYFNRKEEIHLYQKEIRTQRNLEESRRDLKDSMDASADNIDEHKPRNKQMDDSHTSQVQMKKQINVTQVIKLALKNQHRAAQLITFHDEQIPRAIKAVQFGMSLFVHLMFAGLYCTSDTINIGQAIMASFVGLIVQKILLLISNLLIRRKLQAPKKQNDIEEEVAETEPEEDGQPRNKSELVAATRTECETISLAFGLIFNILVISTCLFISFKIAERIDESDNIQYIINFFLALILDLAILESIMVTLGAVLTHKIGSKPDSFGGVRNICLSLTPKALRRAVVPENMGSKLEHQKQNQLSQQQQMLRAQQMQQMQIQQQQVYMYQQQQRQQMMMQAQSQELRRN